MKYKDTMKYAHDPIHGFRGEYQFLSNFYPASVVFENQTYPSVEHAFQAAKTTVGHLRLQFITDSAISPARAKQLGRKLPLRPDWDTIKDSIMYSLISYKFSNNTRLKQLLLATEDRFIEETNYWKDTYWGVCNGAGLNKLGEILMRVRTELQQPATM